MGFFDFDSWLSGCYIKIPHIASVYQANFSKLGVRTKSLNLSQEYGFWRTENKEPYEVLIKSPLTSIPPRLSPGKMESERLLKMKHLEPDDSSKSFWESIMSGGLGTDSNSVIHPDFKVPLEDEAMRKVEGSVEEGESQNMDDIAQEWKVEKFRNLVWDSVDKRYYLETKYLGYKDYYLCDRSCFIDVGDGLVSNSNFEQWESEHKKLKKKFRENKPPKKSGEPSLSPLPQKKKIWKGGKEKYRKDSTRWKVQKVNLILFLQMLQCQ